MVKLFPAYTREEKLKIVDEGCSMETCVGIMVVMESILKRFQNCSDLSGVMKTSRSIDTNIT
jgi:hypothetical protein